MRNGSNYHVFGRTSNPIGRSIYQWVESNRNDSLVSSNQEGVWLVRQGGVAHFVMSSTAEYVVNRNCNLTMLRDTRQMFDTQYAIAMPKDSIYLEPFNRVIREMKQDGTIQKLIENHWENKCKASDNVI